MQHLLEAISHLCILYQSAPFGIFQKVLRHGSDSTLSGQNRWAGVSEWSEVYHELNVLKTQPQLPAPLCLDCYVPSQTFTLSVPQDLSCGLEVISVPVLCLMLAFCSTSLGRWLSSSNVGCTDQVWLILNKGALGARCQWYHTFICQSYTTIL